VDYTDEHWRPSPVGLEIDIKELKYAQDKFVKLV